MALILQNKIAKTTCLPYYHCRQSVKQPVSTAFAKRLSRADLTIETLPVHSPQRTKGLIDPVAPLLGTFASCQLLYLALNFTWPSH